jgi:predicted nuclease with RNAse H fold
MTLAAGIDLSARRGLDLAFLDGQRLTALTHLPDLPATLAWLGEHAPTGTVVGIDAPQGPRLPLLVDPRCRATLKPPPPDGRYLRYRVCDYYLARRGIGLTLSPASGEPVPDWMAVGFALFDALRARGLHTPHHPQDYAATLLEGYPYASFVTMLGYIPPRKSTPAGIAARLAALIAAGVTGLPEAMSHDGLDAVATAHTAAVYAAGNGCALGDVDEGLMVLPVPERALLARYRPLR